MIIYSIEEMINEFGEKETKNKMDSFKNIEDFIISALRNILMETDKNGITKTYFILDNLDDHNILGFFTLQPKEIESDVFNKDVNRNKFEDMKQYKINKLKSLIKKDHKFISVYYITYLAKNSEFEHENLRASNIIDMAIIKICEISNVNIIMIDAYISRPKVCKIYEEYKNGVFT